MCFKSWNEHTTKPSRPMSLLPKRRPLSQQVLPSSQDRQVEWGFLSYPRARVPGQNQHPSCPDHQPHCLLCLTTRLVNLLLATQVLQLYPYSPPLRSHPYRHRHHQRPVFPNDPHLRITLQGHCIPQFTLTATPLSHTMQSSRLLMWEIAWVC